MYGSSFFENWVDTAASIKLQNQGDEGKSLPPINLKFHKHRNSEEDNPIISIEWNRSTLTPIVMPMASGALSSANLKGSGKTQPQS